MNLKRAKLNPVSINNDNYTAQQSNIVFYNGSENPNYFFAVPQLQKTNSIEESICKLNVPTPTLVRKPSSYDPFKPSP